jgi:hypothetical protein
VPSGHLRTTTRREKKRAQRIEVISTRRKNKMVNAKRQDPNQTSKEAVTVLQCGTGSEIIAW